MAMGPGLYSMNKPQGPWSADDLSKGLVYGFGVVFDRYLYTAIAQCY